MQDALNYVLLFLVQFFMLVGLIGLVVPVFPGLLIMWLAALGYGIVAGFRHAGDRALRHHHPAGAGRLAGG